MTVAATLIVGPDEHDRLKAFTRVASSDLAPLGVVHFATGTDPIEGTVLWAESTDGYRLARSPFVIGHGGEPGFYADDTMRSVTRRGGHWCVDARDLAKALGSKPPKTKGWTVVEFEDGGLVTVRTRDGSVTPLYSANHPAFPADRVWPDVDHEHGVMAAHVDYRLLGDLFATAPDPDAGVRLVQPDVHGPGAAAFSAALTDRHAPAVAVDAHGREFGLVMPTRGSDPTPDLEDEPEDEGCVLCTVVAQWGTTCRDHADGDSHG